MFTKRENEKNKYNYTGDASFEDAYHDCNLIHKSIVDDKSFQNADKGLVLYYMDRILEALEKQIPMDRIKKFDNTVSTNWCVCPVCLKGLGWEHTESGRCNYCPKCGQKLNK